MAGIRFTEVRSRPMELLDLTSVTLEEFEQLVAPYETAFQAHMAVWRLDGKPRTARQCSVYKTCPLPTPQDRLFVLLTYLKTYSLQVVQGRLFGMGQSKANKWVAYLQVADIYLSPFVNRLKGRNQPVIRTLTRFSIRHPSLLAGI